MSRHEHSGLTHLASTSGRPLVIALVIISIVMVAEIIGGILSNSLALLGDAAHMFIDALALGLSLFAITIAKRPATLTKTYGYYRVEIMAALINGTVLILVSLFIFYEAYGRLFEPPEVKTSLMLGVAIIGLIANLAGVQVLRRTSHGNLNIRAAFLHVVGDTVSSVGVIVAGIIIAVTGWSIADPIIAVFIGFIILWGAVRLVRESVDILLESVPGHVKMERVVEAIKRVQGVEEVHDVHVWTLTSGVHALSAHLVIADQTVSNSAEIMEAANKDLIKHFNIIHTTLQLECETCPTGATCAIRRHEDEA